MQTYEPHESRRLDQLKGKPLASFTRRAVAETFYERLAAPKNKYDPANLFRLDQSIKPAV